MEKQHTPLIALIEDDDIVRQATTQWLELAGFHVDVFSNATDALLALPNGVHQAVISDVKLPDIDGINLLSQLRDADVMAPVILITGHGDVDMAVKALQLGAYDFIEKPFNPERLSTTVASAVEQHVHQNACDERLQYLQALSGIEQLLIGQSDVMKQLREQVARVATIDTNVIIYGETGAGKELVATALHEMSQRYKHHFVPLNCGAIPENLFESELFGHEAGAFTGAVKRRIGKLEHANKGTVFFDEVESMPLNMQVKVLRCLQENVVERVGANTMIPVDIRVIAAAKEDLLHHAEFRQDLYYRLNVAQLHIPPLRERDHDALLLFEHFALQANPETRSVSDADARSLLAYSWPGNVRELRNVAIRFALDDTLSVVEILSQRPNSTVENTHAGVPLVTQLLNFERKVIHEALLRHQGKITDVMNELDLPRRTLNQKMQKLGLSRIDYTKV